MTRLPLRRLWKTRRLPILILAGALLVLIIVLWVSAGARLRRPAVDPLADYRPALGPRFVLDPVRIDQLLTYSITVQINPTALVYTGTVEVTFPVSSTTPMNELYFRLYPNLRQFNGRLEVTSASVNDVAVSYAYTSQDSAIHIVPPKPLRAGSRAWARIGFAGSPPDRPAGSYSLVGRSDGILSLMGFYPMLAAHRGQEWATDVADPQGDSGFEDAALFKVDVTAPADQVIAATGTQVGRRPAANGWVTTRYVQGPAREFTLLLSPHFQTMQEEAYGTLVRSYFLPEDVDAGKSALYDGLAAMQIYSDAFGPYPYREMDVVEAPLTFRGQEFPGMSLIGIQDYRQTASELERLVSHEVAHQWWYNQVGSDQTMQPWQDEGLAEFSMYFYFTARHGQASADTLRQLRWAAPVSLARQRGIDAPIGRPVTYYDKGNYETIVYGKGALFFATLRDEIGADAFRDLLRTYLANYRWRVAPPEALRTMAGKLAGRDLGLLFSRWLDGAVE
ncbi:MAG TPA: M1 family metallopeptidase [Anaerolineae bacterium]